MKFSFLRLFGTVFFFSAVFVLSGCSLVPGPEDQQKDVFDSNASDDAVMTDDDIVAGAPSNVDYVESGEAFMEFQKMLSSGKPVECRFQSADDNSLTIVYFKSGVYKTISTFDGREYVALVDSEKKKMWSWSPSEKSGSMMDFSCLEDLQKQAPGFSEGNPGFTEGEFSETPEKYAESFPEYDCSFSADVDLLVPTDISFADQCLLMSDDLQSSLNQLPGGVELSQ
ncbi:MAG: hypothetical protein KC736_03190 [Candidatus Moranbacteria bacterium]|nr:hypothetical protein [Candidatus Moranbacteria bacterium]